MKVDVYPNINKVEVYENPISVPVDASWQKVLFTIEDANDTTFVLPSQPMLDRDGDFVLKVFYNAVLAEFSIDYSIDGSTITWLNRFPLEANELIEIWYAPKSAYGSVPGSGEVTSLNHLNDVSIAGPITGQLLVRNNDGKFQNKSLIAGDNVTITNDNADITIASNPNLPLSHLSANGTLENNNAYVIDTSSAPITMQLPATSTLGKVISVQRLGGEQLTISRNGHNVNALAQDITVGDGETVTFRYLDATTGWLKSSSGLTSAGGNGAVQTSDGSGSLVDSGWTISSGHLLPSLNEQYDIGSATNLVRDIYLSNNSLKFGAEGKALSLNAQNKLEFDGTELATGSGIDGLSFSGTLSDGEVIKYDGSNWVNASVDYSQVSNTPSLSTVATTGNYSDLSGTPTLSDVATSGAYTDLTGTPSLATVATSGNYSDLSGTPVLATVATSGAYGDLTGTPSLSTVATTGSYNDLTNKPSLFSGSYTDLTNLPVLFSGAYGDLYGKPTLGTSSSLDVGFNANNVVQLDANAKLPQVDGSQLTNVTATDSTKLAKANNLSDLVDSAQARTNLGVDVAGTDNSTNVTLANVANNYLSITNQEITSGTVPLSLGGTGATTAEAARTALGVDASGTDNSTNVTLANTNYLSITGQEITGGTVPVASGGTGATTAAVARANLGVDASGTDNSTNVTLANTNYLTITGQEITGGTVPVGSGGTGATDATNARTNLGLGTSATLDHGTSAGNLVRLDPTTAKLPAVDGSLLTNLPSGASALNDLSDVVISNSAQDQVVVHNGTNFVNAQLAYSQVSGTPSLAAVATSGDYNDLSNKPSVPVDLDDLGDCIITSPTNGEVLQYNGTNFVNTTIASGGASDLDGLSDVTITSVAEGDTLVYNSSTSVFENIPPHMNIVELSTTTGSYTAKPNDFVVIPEGHVGSGSNTYLYIELPSTTVIGSTITVAVAGDYNFNTSKLIRCDNSGDQIFLWDALSNSGGYVEEVYLENLTLVKFTLIQRNSSTNHVWYADFGLSYPLPLKLTRTSSQNNEFRLNITNGSLLQWTAGEGTVGRGAFKDVALNTIALSSFNNDLGLATVATSGSYNDLSNTPTLGTASALDVGTNANNVVQLDASANIDVSSNSIVTASNADIDLVPNGSGKVIIHGNATSGSGQIKLNCEQNSHGIILKGPAHSALANYTLTFPDALGSNNQVLKTDTNGNLAWVDQASGGGFTYDGTEGSADWTAVLSTHYSVKTNLASGDVTMTLPSASSGGSEIRVKLLDATHSLIIEVQTGETLDDVTDGTTTLSVATQSVTLVDNGTDGWEIV